MKPAYTRMKDAGMDDDQILDTQVLVMKAKHKEVQDFVVSLAVWGFNNQNHLLLWEAMCCIIEAEARGDFPHDDFEWTEI